MAADEEGTYQLRQLRAAYELNEVSSSATVQLALRRDRVRVLDVRVDEQPAEYQWSDDGQSLRVRCENAASRTLVVSLRPIPRNADKGQYAIDIPIPDIPRSRLTVRSDSALNGVQVFGALGKVEPASSQLLTAELGPTNSLQVDWNAVSTLGATRLDGEVAELIWMHVQPNAAVVRARFHLATRDGAEAGFVDVEVDSRLRLLPANGDLDIEEMATPSGRILRCRLQNPSAEQHSLELAFAMSGGLGNIRVPHVSARAERHAPKWLAVSTADGTDVTVSPADRAVTISVAEFLRAWGDDAESPQLALSLSEAVDPWQIAVRPPVEKMSADQQSEIVLALGEAAISYESVISVEQGSSLLQRFRVPAGFEVEDAVVIHDDVDRLLRWARVDAHTLTVFFSSPLSGTYRVWLKGTMPVARSGLVELPLIAAEGREGEILPNARVKILHGDDVRPRLESSPGFTVDPQMVAKASPGQPRLLATLTASQVAPASLVRLNLAPNRPRLQGSLITMLDYRDGRWWADLSLHWQIRNGYVDKIRMRFPSDVELPVERTPAVEFEESDLSGEGDRQVVAYFAENQSESVTLQLRCPLRDAADDLIRAPNIGLPDANSLQRFIVLPRRRDGTPLTWETAGLQAAELPATHPQVERPPESDVYQAVAPHVTAQLKAVERIQGVPQVHLADYRLHWFADRTYHGLAAFEVEPAGLSEMSVVLPNGMQLVHVSVGTIPVLASETGPGRWRIPLGAATSPQHIEVLFHGRRDKLDRSALKTFVAPAIADLPVVETLWTVQGPARFGEGIPSLAHTQANRLELARRRLDSARKLFGATTKGRPDGQPPADAWSENRQQWIKQLETDLAQARAANQSDQLAKTHYDLSVVSAPRFDLSNLRSIPSSNTAPSVYGVMRGAAERFDVRYTDSRWRMIANRGLAVVVLITAMFFSRRVLAIHRLRETLIRYPHFAAAIAGFCWWMWMTPSIAGLSAMVLAAALSLRPAWKTKPA